MRDRISGKPLSLSALPLSHEEQERLERVIQNTLVSIQSSLQETIEMKRVPDEGILLDGTEGESLLHGMHHFDMPEFGLSGVAATHKNQKRKPNEDIVVVVPKLGILGVFDGMGGHDDGLFASGIFGDRILFLDEIPSIEMMRKKANDAVREMCELGNGGNCGTTCLIYSENGFHVADGENECRLLQAGDSRCMTYSSTGAWKWATRDESKVNTLSISEDERLYHEERNIITNSVSPMNRSVRFIEHNPKVESGDYIILCTDGITDSLTNEEIGIIIGGKSPEKALIDLKSVLEKRWERCQLMHYLMFFVVFGYKMMFCEGIVLSGNLTEKIKNGTMTESDFAQAQKWFKTLSNSEQEVIQKNARPIWRICRRELGHFPDGFQCHPSDDHEGIIIAQKQ